MTTKTKPSKAAASRTTTKTRQELAAELQTLIDPFGWKVDQNAIPSLQAAELDAVSTWLDEAWTKTPLAAWQLIVIPNEQWIHSFGNKNDAMAIVSTILSHRGEFAPDPEDPVARLIDHINESGAQETRFGWIFLEAAPELQLWFGRKAGKPPALFGDAARIAIQKLFNVAITAPRDEPRAKTVEKPKSTARQTVREPKVESGKPASTSEKLWPQTRQAAKRAATAAENSKSQISNFKSEIQHIDIALIRPDSANREMSDGDQGIKDLAANIREIGLLQPITVRPMHDTDPETFVITAGERRWRACRLLGFKSIPAIVRDTAGVDTAVSRISENVHRENLTPSELATEYSRLIAAGKTQKEIGELFGDISQGQVSNTIRLLELPPAILKHVDAKTVAPTLVRDVLAYCDLPPIMEAVEKMIDTCVKKQVPVERRDLRSCLQEAVKKNSRSMIYDSGWSDYMSPDAKKRHFKNLSEENRKALAPREFKDLLHTWDGQTRTFNLKLFGELNAKPLADRRQKHADRKAARSGSASPAKAKKEQVKYFDSEYGLADRISESLAADLATVLEKHRDRPTVHRIALAVAFASEGTIADAILGNRIWGQDHVIRLLEALTGTPKQIDDIIRAAAIKLLREGDTGSQHKFILRLGSELNTDLLAFWKPTEAVLKQLTPAGLKLIEHELDSTDAAIETLLKAWPAGYMPSFIRELVKPPAAKKTKKGKAA